MWSIEYTEPTVFNGTIRVRVFYKEDLNSYLCVKDNTFKSELIEDNWLYISDSTIVVLDYEAIRYTVDNLAFAIKKKIEEFKEELEVVEKKYTVKMNLDNFINNLINIHNKRSYNV